MVDILWNFISPVTGRILSDPKYVLVGNSAGIATPSPLLIDLQLDLLSLSRTTSEALTADFIIGTPNAQLPNAQVLNTMANGYVYNTAGIVSTIGTIPIGDLPNLTHDAIWIGNSANRPVENATISLSNLPDLTNGKIWIGNILSRPIEGYAIPGPEGPRGDRGVPGPPGLDATAVLKQIFVNLLGALIPYVGTLSADVINYLFEKWLNVLLKGATGLIGSVGIIGAIGVAGLQGTAGLFGQAKKVTLDRLLIRTNYDMNGNRIENLSQSPQGDFDAITAKWVWDLLNDNVIIIWQ